MALKTLDDDTVEDVVLVVDEVLVAVDCGEDDDNGVENGGPGRDYG